MLSCRVRRLDELDRRACLWSAGGDGRVMANVTVSPGPFGLLSKAERVSSNVLHAWPLTAVLAVAIFTSVFDDDICSQLLAITAACIDRHLRHDETQISGEPLFVACCT